MQRTVDKASYVINTILPLERDGKIKVLHHASTVAAARKQGRHVEYDFTLQAHICHL